MPSETTLAEYLFTRLRQLGVGSVHGVPGDFNLDLLDFVEPYGLRWVGNANELNAGYAADGYARIKGVGALITTFGVGELSAINAIAGAYAERAAVVHIVGTPPRAVQDKRLLVHHTFNDGNYRRFGQMHAQVTVAQASLRDPQTCPELIDGVLQQCLLQSRPVYIEFPIDMVAEPVSGERLGSKLQIPYPKPTSPSVIESTMKQVLDRIYSAKQPVILVDGETRAMGLVDDVQSLVKATSWPTWSSVFGKGLLDESLPNFHGIYTGVYGDPEVKSFIDKSDLVLCFGPHFSSTNSFAYTSIPEKEVTIFFTDTALRIEDMAVYIPARYAVSHILQQLESNPSKPNPYTTYPKLPRDETIPFSDTSKDDPITQDKVWQLFANFLRPGDILLGETGTSGYGCREMKFPPHVRLFAPVTWLSIGYMLPAAQGAALAQQELAAAGGYYGVSEAEARTILIIGDGSFQMTVQEMGTIINHKLNVIVFLVNNDGYTIERVIHGLRQGYNDVARWRYLEAPRLFGAKEDTYLGTAKTWGELEKVLTDEKLLKSQGLKMVEIFMDREDVPRGPLLEYLKKQKALLKE